MVIVVDPGGDKHAYQTGRHMEVTDGHLIIRDAAAGTVIGIFAPGKWQSAHIDVVPAPQAGGAGGMRPGRGAPAAAARRVLLRAGLGRVRLSRPIRIRDFRLPGIRVLDLRLGLRPLRRRRGGHGDVHGTSVAYLYLKMGFRWASI